jgi:hypothetical protein
VAAHLPQEIVGIARLRHDLVARVLEQAGGALAQQDRVVRDHDPHELIIAGRVPEC